MVNHWFKLHQYRQQQQQQQEQEQPTTLARLDFEDAERAVAAYRACGFKGHIYLMPVGGVESVYTLNNRKVAELAMAKGLRYSDRLQVPLFKNEWGT